MKIVSSDIIYKIRRGINNWFMRDKDFIEREDKERKEKVIMLLHKLVENLDAKASENARCFIENLSIEEKRRVGLA